jgi:peptidoglycan/LPS O-acetylase OafA/YrhL
VRNNLGMLKSKKPVQRADIQVLRGLSVTAVVLFHAKQNFFPNGYLGVDVFFVISGCLIIKKIFQIELLSKPGNTNELWRQIRIFWTKRYLRLFPALNIVLVLTLLIAFLFANPFELRNIVNQAIGGFLSIGNLTALETGPSYFSGNSNPTTHLWSTSTEIQIYLLCTGILLISLLFKKFKFVNLQFCFYVLGIFSLLSFVNIFVYRVIGHQENMNGFQDSNYYSPAARVWEIVLPGILFTKLKFNFHFGPFVKKFVLISIFILILVPYKLPTGVSIIVVVSISTLYLLCVSDPTSFFSRSEKIFIWLGDRAYSIFLLHLPIFYFARHTPLIEASSKTLPMLISLLLLLPLASVLFQKIEKKFMQYDLLKENAKNLFVLHLVTLLLLLTSYFFFTSNNKLLSTLPVAKMLAGENQLKKQTDWDINCKLDHSTQNSCEYLVNDNNDKTIILLGDSTAAVSSQTVVRTAEQYGWNSYTWFNSACPFFIDPNKLKSTTNDLSKMSKSNRNCFDLNRKKMEFIKETKPALVIVQFRTTQFYKSILTRELIAKTIDDISAISNKVILILPHPEFKSFTLSQFGPEQRVSKLPTGPFLDRKYFLGYNFDPNVVLIDSIANLCDLEECNFFDSDSVLYSDLYHLNDFGSTQNLKELDSIIKNWG